MKNRICLDNLKGNLYTDICTLVEEAKSLVAHTANKTITVLYWKIGERINSDLLDGKRAEYGKQIVSQLETQLQMNYGKRGFEERNIRRMMQFAALFSDFQIVSQAATILSWSHFIERLSLKEEIKGNFISRCRSVKTGDVTLTNAQAPKKQSTTFSFFPNFVKQRSR